MKAFLGIFLIVIGGYFLSLQTPWWAVFALCFLVGLVVNSRASIGFWYGFWAMFALWGGMAFQLDIQNGSLLSSTIGKVFMLNGFSMIVLAGFLGALLGGLSTLSGTLLRHIFQNPQVEVAKQELPTTSSSSENVNL